MGVPDREYSNAAFSTITAKRINIVNDTGKIQAVFTSDTSGGRLDIHNREGEYQARLGVGNYGGFLAIHSTAGETQAMLGANEDGGQLDILNAARETQAILGVGENGGVMYFYDNNDKKWCPVAVDKADQGMAIDAPAGNDNNKITDDADKAELMRIVLEGSLYDTAEMKYYLYLKTPEWQTLRRIKLETAGHRCQICYSDAGPLEVHHRTYERRGKERLDDLTVLCRRCHQAHHDADTIPPYPPERPRPANHPPEKEDI